MFLWSFVDVPLFFSVLQQTTYRIGNHVYYWVWFRPDILFFFALVLFFPFPSDQIGGGFLVCYFFPLFLFFCFVFFGCSDGMEREACVCDHGFERSDLCAEIIIIIIIRSMSVYS